MDEGFAMNQVNIQKNGRVAVVRFDRGHAANPLSMQLMRELTEAARQFEEDAATSSVILSGRADNFTFGFDLKDTETRALRALPLEEQRITVAQGRRMCRAWEDLPQLTISAIEGWCVGGGVALAVATDLRIAGQETVFSVPEIERGMNMSWGSVPRITNLVGPARAKRIILLAEQLSASEAVAWGLADRTVATGEAVEAALQMAERAAAMPPVALKMGKQAINAYANALAETASHADFDQFALAINSEDGVEGIASFLEKRDPRFNGR